MNQYPTLFKYQILKSMPGQIYDQDVDLLIARIEKFVPADCKYDALDELDFLIQNRHPHGMAADKRLIVQGIMERL